MPNQPSKLLLMLALCSGIPAHLACQGEKLNKRDAKIMEEARSEDRKIDFYGKVLDDHDQPVEGAEVTLGTIRFDPRFPTEFFQGIRRFSLITDRDGCFAVHGERGRSLYIEDIKKRSYDDASLWPGKTEHDDFNYSRTHVPSRPVHVPDPKRPVVYRMRKRGEEVVLITHGSVPRCSTFKLSESGSQKAYDVIKGVNIEEKDFFNLITKSSISPEPLYCDIKTKAIFNLKSKTWKLIISPGNPEGGVLLSDQFLYEAPASGYKPFYIVDPEVFNKEFPDSGKTLQDKGPYLYLKSRNPPIFTRFEMGPVRVDETSISLGLGLSFTNPFGDRNLEEAKDLPIEVRKKIEDEVSTAYRFNPTCRPLKPDLQKFIQEWEKGHPPTKGAKSWYK